MPVYKAINDYPSVDFCIVFSRKRTPPDVVKLVQQELGMSAISLTEEKTINFCIDRYGESNKGFRLAFQPDLFKTIAQIKPDVLISEGFGQWTPVVLIYSLLNRGRLVISYERTSHTERNAGFFRTTYRKIIAKFVHAVVCNGALSKEYCSDSLGIDSKKIVTNGMAFDPRFLAGSTQNINTKETKNNIKEKHNLQGLVFLFVGRLVQPKGVMELLEAWKLFSKKHNDDISLLIVGDGPASDLLQKTIESGRLNNIKLFGTAEHQQLSEIYKASDIFVIPTLEDNWSLVVMEAMASGLPILCSKYNGCWPELVKTGINGWVFDPLDASSFVSALETCWDSRSRFDEMGRESVNIIKNYSPEHAARSFLIACGIEENIL